MKNEKNSMENSGLRQRTHDGVDKIMDKAESMRDSSKEALAHMKEKALLMKESVDGYIIKNPEKSVLMAAGIGLLVGGVLTAIMMRRRD